jgi:hypothetical protein
MFKRFWPLLTLTLLLSGCANLGLTGLTLSLDDIADRAFLEQRGELARVLRLIDGVDIGRPEVGYMPDARRLHLGWTIGLRQAGLPLSVRVAISGRPELNAQRNGIDLADSRIEDLRLPAIPLIGLGRSFVIGEPLGRLPLLSLTPAELSRAGIIHQAAGIALSPRGMHIDLAPR